MNFAVLGTEGTVRSGARSRWTFQPPLGGRAGGRCQGCPGASPPCGAMSHAPSACNAGAESAEVRKPSIHAGLRPVGSAGCSAGSAECRRADRSAPSAPRPSLARQFDQQASAGCSASWLRQHQHQHQRPPHVSHQASASRSTSTNSAARSTLAASVSPTQRESEPATAPHPGPAGHSSRSPRIEDRTRYTVHFSAPGGEALQPKCLPSVCRCPRSFSSRRAARSL